MRYIDSGSRDSNDAVGTWLDATLRGGQIAAFRLQSGYVGPQPFGYLESAFSELATRDGETSIVIGSNGGETARETVEDVLRLAGSPRQNLRLGVASFADGLFHPKVYHITRTDHSMAAYVGSANFTFSGVSGKNIEAGISLDTQHGDEPAVLLDIASAIDNWFLKGRPGIFSVNAVADIERLVSEGVLGTPTAQKRTRSASTRWKGRGALRALRGLVRLPAISAPMAIPGPAATAVSLDQSTLGTLTPSLVIESWSKELSASDAQRKQEGNQSGVVALTQGKRRGEIDQTTYFRNDLFGGSVWQQAPTRTGHMMDTAQVPMHVTVSGEYLGVRAFEVTHDHGREADQNNYTAKLSLRPIREKFDTVNMTGRVMKVARDADGDFWLNID